MLVGCFNANAQSPDKLSTFFSISDYYFRKYVHKGLVNYQYASRNLKEINAIHKLIGEVNLSGATGNEKKAFYINAYNLLVIQQVVKSYPISKPMDKIGFFDQIEHKVAGEMLTLNEVEHQKLRAAFKDAELHFVLACAAISCPRLANFAYKPDNVNQLLGKRTAMMLNDDNFIRVNPRSRVVEVSKIFEWYEKDFTKSGTSLIEYINRYRAKKIPNNFSISYYEYHWALNERKM